MNRRDFVKNTVGVLVGGLSIPFIGKKDKPKPPDDTSRQSLLGLTLANMDGKIMLVLRYNNGVVGLSTFVANGTTLDLNLPTPVAVPK